MDALAECLVTRELVEKRVAELVALGLPPAAVATELLTQATVLMINCPVEQAREQALQFWETVFRGIQNAVADHKVSGNVLPFGVQPPANLA